MWRGHKRVAQPKQLGFNPRYAQCDREGVLHSQSTVRGEGYCRFHDHFVAGLFREPLRLEL